MKHCPRLMQYSRTYSRHGNIHHVYEAFMQLVQDNENASPSTNLGPEFVFDLLGLRTVGVYNILQLSSPGPKPFSPKPKTMGPWAYTKIS